MRFSPTGSNWMTYAWWQSGVVYQIYPRSFQDSNADGIGDLRGVIHRIPYLQGLGVRAVWLSPIYPSPMADFGYDISNFVDIDPVFGTLADFDELVETLHAADLKLILDFVPNHTSDYHPWFVESRQSRENAKRDWYIWRDPAPSGGPPTNWLSEFGGSAWTFDTVTMQYYYHAYLPQQPDLNWRNPEVRDAMFSVMRFWLARGVDGFRVDAIHMLIEDEHLRDNPINPVWQTNQSPALRLLRVHTADQHATHDAIRQMREITDEYCDRVLIGEAYLPIPQLMRYYGESLAGFHLPFNFHLIGLSWNARSVAALVNEYDAAIPPGGWPNWVLGNHDKSRVVSRLGGLAQGRQAAVLLLTLRGTPTIYNGEEIGMIDGKISPEQVQDPWEHRAPGLGLGRDPCRTPMQWNGEEHSGFSTVAGWLPLAEHHATRNVAYESADPTSMLGLYLRLIHLRNEQAALAMGAYREILVSNELFVFERSWNDRRVLIALNFASRPQSVRLPYAVTPVLSSSRNFDPGERVSEPLLWPLEALIGMPV
jgi:alpha-glucosidase